jgi:transaldolase
MVVGGWWVIVLLQFCTLLDAFQLGGGCDGCSGKRTLTTTLWGISATASSLSQLEQLASMTTLSIDSGDLNIIRKFSATGCITDATTNPLFVAQAGLSSDMTSEYSPMVQLAIQEATVDLAIDRLSVELGTAIAKLVRGYVSTEVDPRLSFDTQASIERALRIIRMYEQNHISKDRILIKLAATWEGIQAAHILETKHDIRCNLTLIFSTTQAICCAQHGVHLISPFPGRILDWHKAKSGRTTPLTDANLDEGVVACREMYRHYKTYGYDTICMPASWRPSRGPGYDLDEIRALAGTDRMTIPPALLEQLQASYEPLERILSTDTVTPKLDRSLDPIMTEAEFRYRMTMDGCGNDKLAEGIRAFVELTEKLEISLQEKMAAAVPAL